MMMKTWMAAIAALTMSIAYAADDAPLAPVSVPTQAAVAQNTPTAPTATETFFAKPVFLRGTLGGATIQFSLRPKEVADEGLEGEYFAFGGSGKVLLAGEVQGDALLLEESENGKDISGQWDGKLQGDQLVGNWTSADGSITKPFSLTAIAQKNTAPQASKLKKTAIVVKQ